MDFFKVVLKDGKINGENKRIIYPDFNIRKLKDFMCRGRSFYAVWDEDSKLWSKDPHRPLEIIDSALYEYDRKLQEDNIFNTYVDSMMHWVGGRENPIQTYNSWIKMLPDMYTPLDSKVTYLSQETTKKDYASKRLPYDLDQGMPESYNEIMSTLYDLKERRKLEWAVGAVLNGDAGTIQKMLVLYGPPGSGKSTFLHILEQLLEGYWTTFEAKSLVSNSNDFATHFFKDGPLVAIQHDGQLSKIEDNSLLNSIISHEDIVVNEKFKAQYVARANCMLFLGTNSPVKISDSKSGLIRRVIDVNPSGRKISNDRYWILMERIPFELGRIANHCLKVYRRFGKRHYDNYRPLSMMKLTDVFFNFVLDNRLLLESEDPMDLQHIYDIYKNYCEETKAGFISQRYKFRNELENYYDSYESSSMKFYGFRSYILDEADLGEDSNDNEENVCWITLDQRTSIFDDDCKDCLAQYGNKDEIPFEKWEKVTKTLKEIDTSKLHYVKLPESHIVIDFDLKNEKGEKDAKLNLEAANKWPPTYAEYSKGGNGIHLHYIWDGDISTLSRVYSEEGIEVKVFTGNSSLRRKLTFCNNLPIAHISSGLPLKEDKKMINMDMLKDEQHLRNCIKKALRKEVHAYTKPSVDYIYKVLEDAYKSGMHYDVRDMRQGVLTFAMKSTNQREACVKLVNGMKFCSDGVIEAEEVEAADDRIVAFDIEVFPNLFVVCWKFHGDPDDKVIAMINPTSKEIGNLMKYKLAAYNGRSYDGHILYGAYIGETPQQLYRRSQKIIIEKDPSGFFKQGYNVCFIDPYDYAVKKQGLKKYEIDLDIHHQECPFEWDEPVAEKDWPIVVEYCKNDVNALDAVITSLRADFVAREMLAGVAKKPLITPTNALTRQIIFRGNKNPKSVYSDFEKGVAS